MATALCKQCGKVWHHRQTRGFRLADCRCPCGGEFGKAKAVTENGSGIGIITSYRLIEPGESHAKGKKMGTCPVCGKRRLEGKPCWYHKRTDGTYMAESSLVED